MITSAAVWKAGLWHRTHSKDREEQPWQATTLFWGWKKVKGCEVYVDDKADQMEQLIKCGSVDQRRYKEEDNKFQISSVQSLSRVWLCNPINCSTPGPPVHHQLPEFTQTHVHRVGDTTQPFHPLSSPSPPAFNLSQHQGLFYWVDPSHQVANVSASALASVLSINIQDWFSLGLTGLIALLSKGLSRVFSKNTVQKRQFFGPQLYSQSKFHIHAWPLEKP